MHTLLFFCPTSSRAQCASRWLISAPKRLILPAPYTVQGFPAEAQLFLPENTLLLTILPRLSSFASPLAPCAGPTTSPPHPPTSRSAGSTHSSSRTAHPGPHDHQHRRKLQPHAPPASRRLHPMIAAQRVHPLSHSRAPCWHPDSTAPCAMTRSASLRRYSGTVRVYLRHTQPHSCPRRCTTSPWMPSQRVAASPYRRVVAPSAPPGVLRAARLRCRCSVGYAVGGVSCVRVGSPPVARTDAGTRTLFLGGARRRVVYSRSRLYIGYTHSPFCPLSRRRLHGVGVVRPSHGARSARDALTIRPSARASGRTAHRRLGSLFAR
jgi:hypothetical protein